MEYIGYPIGCFLCSILDQVQCSYLPFTVRARHMPKNQDEMNISNIQKATTNIEYWTNTLRQKRVFETVFFIGDAL